MASLSEGAGLTFEDAVKAAQDEVGLATDQEPEATQTEQTEPQGEQPPEEDTASEEEPGLFDSLELEEEQPDEGTPPSIDPTAEVEVPGHGKLSIQEVVNGYMRQADATAKWQEAAQMRDSAEDAIELWKAIQENPVETVATLAQAAGFDVDADSVDVPVPFGQNGEQDSEAVRDLVREELKSALANDPTFQTVQQKTALDLVNEQFDSIEQSHNVELKQKDRLKVLKMADKLGVPDLEFVFSGMLKRAELTQKQRENAGQAATTRSSGHGTPDTEAGQVSVESFDDAVKAAISDLGMRDFAGIEL